MGALSSVVIILAAIAGFLVADFQKHIMLQIDAQSAYKATNWTAFEQPDKQTQKFSVAQIQAKIAETYEKMSALETEFFRQNYDRTQADENYYQGEKNAQGQREGIGRVVLPSGDSYLGQWKSDSRHGIGGVGYPGGEIIVAEWRLDSPHGWGEHITSDGWKYIGQFKLGLADGQGVVYYGDGASYHGEFKEGQENGWGTFEDSKIIHEGEFVKAERHGKAKVTSKIDGKVVFEGKFKNNKPMEAPRRRSKSTQ